MFVEPEHSLNGQTFRRCHMFQHPHAGGAHGNDPSGVIDCPGSGFRKKKMLRMHLMVFYPVRLDGTECSYPHVQG